MERFLNGSEGLQNWQFTIFDMYTLNQQKRYFIAMQNVISVSPPPYMCGTIYNTTFNEFSWYLNTICNSMWQEWVKSLISRKKIVQKLINTKLVVPGGCIITGFLAQYTFYTSCRKYKPTKQLLINFFSTSVSNTLSPLKYIRNFV